MRLALWIMAAVPVLVSGCYGAKMMRQPITVEETARDLEAVRQQQAALEKRLDLLEKRSAEQSDLLRGLRAESGSNWEDLNNRLMAIDTKLRDALGSRGGSSYSQSPSYWGASPRRAGADTSSAMRPPGVAAATDSGVAGEGNAELDAKRVYDQAYLDLTRGNYSLAVLGFREFLRRSPGAELGDNAQYWIGECFYAQRDFNTAIQEFIKVQEQNSKGDKVPAALLKIGYSYLQLEDRASARRYLNQVIEEYPNSDEAGLAKNKLRAAG